eukprot:gene13223-13330_t
MAVAPGPLDQVLAALPRDLAVALLDDRVRLALNGQILAESGGIALGAGDELAFLPPGPFDPAVELARFTAAVPAAGGIVSFLGKVRGDAGVMALEIRHYAPMTLPGFRALADTAARRWPLDGLLLLHRVGEMGPDAPIVLVAAASRHRRVAFAATDFVMDHLKARTHRRGLALDRTARRRP